MAMLFRVRWGDAPGYGMMFAGHTTPNRGAGRGAVPLRTPDGAHVAIPRDGMREAPGGTEALIQCAGSWPDMVGRAGRNGPVPLPAGKAEERRDEPADPNT